MLVQSQPLSIPILYSHEYEKPRRPLLPPGSSPVSGKNVNLDLSVVLLTFRKTIFLAAFGLVKMGSVLGPGLGGLHTSQTWKLKEPLLFFTFHEESFRKIGYGTSGQS